MNNPFIRIISFFNISIGLGVLAGCKGTIPSIASLFIASAIGELTKICKNIVLKYILSWCAMSNL